MTSVPGSLASGGFEGGGIERALARLAQDLPGFDLAHAVLRGVTTAVRGFPLLVLAVAVAILAIGLGRARAPGGRGAAALAAGAALCLAVALTAAASAAVVPVADAMLDLLHLYVGLAERYAAATPTGGAGPVLIALLALLVGFAAVLVLLAAAAWLALAGGHRALRRRFGADADRGAAPPLVGVARGAAALAWVLVLPVLYGATRPVFRWLAVRASDRFVAARPPAEQDWWFVLTSGPLLFVASFALLFWLLRGGHAIGHLARLGLAAAPAVRAAGPPPA